MPQRTIAIGDVHGCDSALEALLTLLNVTADDVVVLLGDVVDRGPGSKQAVERLLELQQVCSLVFLKGNHEEMLLESREGGSIQNAWLRYGGWETLNSYGGGYGMIPDSHWKFFESGRDYWETDDAIFVHANLEPGQPLAAQSADWLRWTRVTGKEPPRECGRRVICGHSSQSSGQPLIGNGWVCLDTHCYGGQFLTALDLTSDLIYQADQTGETRGPIPLKDIGVSLES